MSNISSQYTHKLPAFGYFSDIKNNWNFYNSVIRHITSTRTFLKEFGPHHLLSKKRSFSTVQPLSSPEHVSNARNPNNKGLVVFIHGLGSSPATGNDIYKKGIEKQIGNEFEIWVPYVPKQGNCSLEEAAEPILKMIEKYIETNPGKPVQLIGHSNGGRIAAYVETRLRHKEVDMRVTALAGVFFGSSYFKNKDQSNLIKLFLSKTIVKELTPGSSVSKDLIEAMRERIDTGSREYTFYATVGDLAIPNYHSCLPKIHQNERCYVVSGCGHSEIQEKVSEVEIERIIDFLQRHQPGL